VGIVLNFTHASAASPSQADQNAARWFDGYFYRWFLDPVYGCRYPADMVEAYFQAGHLPNGLDFVQPGDMEAMAVPTDFLGVNYYTRAVLRDENAADNLPHTVVSSSEETAMGWEIYPDGLYELLCRLHFAYQIPKLYIAENGCAYHDRPGADGRIHDDRRTDYLRRHFAATQRAIQAGSPVQGYFVWSLMDNFE